MIALFPEHECCSPGTRLQTGANVAPLQMRSEKGTCERITCSDSAHHCNIWCRQRERSTACQAGDALCTVLDDAAGFSVPKRVEPAILTERCEFLPGSKEI